MDAHQPSGADPVVPGADETEAAETAEGQAAPWVVDLLFGVVVALAIALIIGTDQGGHRSPDVPAYLFAASFGGLLLLRRAYPRVVLAVTVLGLFAYYTMGYPPIGVAIPVVAAMYAATEVGRLVWSVATGVVVIGVSTYFRLDEGEPVGYLVGYELVTNGALIAAAIALGDRVRARRVERAQQREINRLTALQLRRDAERRMQDERDSIARDLHDLVGHTMSVITVQANVASEAIGRDGAMVRQAVDRISTATTDTMRELRGTVRVLRSPGRDSGAAGADSARPREDDRAGRRVLSLADVETVVASARAAGIEASTKVEVAAGTVSPAIDAAAYRIVQEALTNVIRHAEARQVWIRAAVADQTLVVTVTDDGRGMASTAMPEGPAGPQGYGLAGMAERARLLGGSLTTQSGADGGFTVEAQLPARLTA